MPRNLSLLAGLAIACLPTTGFADQCSDLTAALSNLKGGAALTASKIGKPYEALFDECDATDKFAGKPLPKHNGRSLTCSGDRNHVTGLLQYPDKTIVFTAKGSVDADGSKFACGSGWPNQCGTWLQYDAGSEHKGVDSEQVPFVVVPIDMKDTGISFQSDSGIRAGDLAIALYKGKCSFGVVGDAGPYYRLGELSLRSHADLGHDRCKIKGQKPCTKIIDSSLPRNVKYIIFPGSRPKNLTSQTINTTLSNEFGLIIEKFLSNNTK